MQISQVHSYSRKNIGMIFLHIYTFPSGSFICSSKKIPRNSSMEHLTIDSPFPNAVNMQKSVTLKIQNPQHICIT